MDCQWIKYQFFFLWKKREILTRPDRSGAYCATRKKGAQGSPSYKLSGGLPGGSRLHLFSSVTTTTTTTTKTTTTTATMEICLSSPQWQILGWNNRVSPNLLLEGSPSTSPPHQSNPYLFLSVCLSICLSACLSVSLSVCQPIFLPLSLFLY